MQKTFLTITLCLLASLGMAEDVLQIRPQQIVPGTETKDKRTFSIEMNNENTFVAMQFDLWLPSGVTIQKSYIKQSTNRFPFEYNDIDEKNEFFHELTCVQQSAGQYRITCSSNDAVNNVISGNSGTIFNIYYTSDSDMTTGILPVRITDVVLAIDGNHDVKPADCTTFFYTPDVDFSTLTSIDLTDAEGVTTQDVSAAARSLMTNPNSLLYLNEGSAAESLQNVVVGNQCENLVLTDAEPFSAPKAFTATNASYTRTLSNDGWYSLCLPFAAETPTNVQVEHFYQIADNVISFKSGNIDADVPCIFNAKAGTVTFSKSNADVSETPVALLDGNLTGTYKLLAESEITGNYILRADGTGFAIASATAYIQPFRAMVSNVAGARFLTMKHEGDITAIEVIQTSHPKTQNNYNLQGQKVQHDYKGITITNGKKQINK